VRQYPPWFTGCERTTSRRRDLAQTIAHTVQFEGGKQFKVSGEMMAKITAAHLVECLRKAGYVVMKRPGAPASAPYRALTYAMRSGKQEAELATVYSIKVWDHAEGAHIIVPTKGTAVRVILLRGKIVPGTEEDVPDTDIDEQFRYSPASEG
jgi:hypothetical protein